MNGRNATRTLPRLATGLIASTRSPALVAMLAVCMSTSCKPASEASASQTATTVPGEPPALAISVEQQATWVRNFNPFMTGKYRWPTVGPIHEPMFIYSTARDEYVPWLATAYAWSEDKRSLTFTLRRGVTWSDGAPFGPDDVRFSFELGKKHPALDSNGVWSYLSAVRTAGPDAVVFDFARPYVPGFATIAQLPIVPQHVWSRVADPTTFSNAHPVGTGPFTTIVRFQNQMFELGRNPHYWQPERFKVTRLRFPAIATNEQATLALLKGDLDWTGTFIPDIENVYVRKDPAHHGYWYSATGATVQLYANTQRAPFDDSRVRKAISLAIDRDKLTKVAMYGYTRPADVTGLTAAYDAWRDPAAVASASWTTHDVARANALLDEAGLARGPEGVRRTPGGKPVRYAINVITGWSDWVRTCQLIANDLRTVGVEAVVKPYDFGAWFDKLQLGDFDLSIAWSSDGVTPYRFYRDQMSSTSKKPLGVKSGVNWQRFSLPEADDLLTRFEATEEPAEQKRLMNALQALYVVHAPAIPLFAGPVWGVYNARHFRGYPVAARPYAVLSPNQRSNWNAEYMLVLANLEPTTAR